MSPSEHVEGAVQIAVDSVENRVGVPPAVEIPDFIPALSTLRPRSSHFTRGGAPRPFSVSFSRFFHTSTPSTTTTILQLHAVTATESFVENLEDIPNPKLVESR